MRARHEQATSTSAEAETERGNAKLRADSLVSFVPEIEMRRLVCDLRTGALLRREAEATVIANGFAERAT